MNIGIHSSVQHTDELKIMFPQVFLFLLRFLPRHLSTFSSLNYAHDYAQVRFVTHFKNIDTTWWIEAACGGVGSLSIKLFMEFISTVISSDMVGVSKRVNPLEVFLLAFFYR